MFTRNILKEIIQQKYKTLSAITASVVGLYAMRALYCYIHRKYNQYPPGPTGFPFVGDLFSMLNPLKLNAYLATNYGPISMIYVAQQPFVFLNSIDLIHEIFNNQHALYRDNWSKSLIFGYLQPHELPSMLINPPFWKNKRKMFQSVLLSRLDSQFLNKAHNESLTELLKSVQNCMEHNILWYPSKDIEYIMFNAIFNAAFASNLPPDSEIQNKLANLGFRTTVQSALDIALMQLKLTSIVPYAWLESFSFSFKKVTDYMEILIFDKLGYDEKIWDLNDVKWEKHFKEVLQNTNSCLISKMIAMHRTKPDITSTKNVILAEIAAAVFIAGTETTQNVAEYGVILLGKYTKYQLMIYDEIANILGNDWKMEQIAVKSIVNKLHYLRAFVHETIRLSNVGAIGVPHRNDVDIWTKDKKYKIPKNSVIVSGIHIADRSDPFWIHKTNGNPNSLCLEAWLDKNGHFSYLVNKDKMMGFSTGARDCAGRAYALRSLYILFIKLILNLKFKLEDENIEIKQKFVFMNRIDPKIGLVAIPR